MEMNEHSPAIFEKELSTYLIDQAPYQLPDNFKEGFVKYAPYVMAVILILAAIPLLFALIGIVALLLLGAVYSVIVTALSLFGVALSALSLPGLFAQKRSGWVLWYYGDLISILATILGFHSGIIFNLVLNILFLYIMFQVKSYYK